MTPSSPQKSWYIANWSPLGWLETAIKLVALMVAMIALSVTSGTFSSPSGARLVQVIVLVILSLGLTAGIADRYQQREIIAMLFIVINNVGHWGMVYALLTKVASDGSLTAKNLMPIFAGLMLLGDLVKLVWLRVSGHTQDGYPQSVLYGLVGVYVVGYIIILLLALGGS
jgi:hypothetical protein